MHFALLSLFRNMSRLGFSIVTPLLVAWAYGAAVKLRYFTADVSYRQMMMIGQMVTYLFFFDKWLRILNLKYI